MTAAAAVPEAKAIILSTATTTVGDAVLLILALCFHSVFEGIAIGIAGWNLFLVRAFENPYFPQLSFFFMFVNQLG
jgi:hypothetical protein